jgi:mono/diheme cytochrome c family protein
MNRLALPLLALAAALTFSAAAGAASGNDPFAGKKVYDTRCAGCHGDRGIPMFPGTPSFARGERLMQPDRTLLASVKNGKNLCPSWRRVVTDADLLNVLAYIRTLHKY